MDSSKANPYKSPATARPVTAEPTFTLRNGRLWVATMALIVAVACIIAVHCIIQSLLSVGLWDETNSAERKLYRSLHVGSVVIFLLGILACGVCAIWGNWVHRIAIALVAVPYAPLFMQLCLWASRRFFS